MRPSPALGHALFEQERHEEARAQLYDILNVEGEFQSAAKYSFSQYLGAAVVLFGIVVVLIPSMIPSLSPAAIAASAMGGDDETDSSSSTSSSGGGDKGGGDLLWIGILVISCVPMCLSSVYKEIALGEMEIDVVYLNGWVAVFQFLMAIPLVIPSGDAYHTDPSPLSRNHFSSGFRLARSSIKNSFKT